MKKNKLKGVIVSAAVLVAASIHPAPATAAENLDQKLEQGPALSDLIRYAYERNPSIEEAREAWRATVEKFRIETGYPDPELSVTFFPDPIETRLGPQDWNASISQRIPFPGKLSKAGDIVEAEAQIARLKLERTVRDIIVSIRESFHELLYTRKAREVAEQNLKLIDHLRKVAETSFAQERSTLLDVVKAQSQIGQLRYDILLLEDLERTEAVRLNALLNRHPDALLGEMQTEAVKPVVLSLGEIYQLAETSQEEIQMAAVQVERAERQAELARYQNFPDFRVGFFYAGIGNPDVASPPRNAGEDAYGIQAGISIPLWFGKNKGRVGRAQAEIRQAEAAKTSRVNTTRSEIRALYFRLENAQRLITLYRDELLPQSAKAIEIAETWYREGQASFSDFIETQAVWYNFQLALARAHADYEKFLARLERLVGRSVTERGDALYQGDPKEAK